MGIEGVGDWWEVRPLSRCIYQNKTARQTG
jgi:hypothetical protein